MTKFHRLAIKRITLNLPNRKLASEWLNYPATMTAKDALSYWMFYRLSLRRMFERYLEEMEFKSWFPFIPMPLPDGPEMGELGPV